MFNRVRGASLDAFGLRDQRNRIFPVLEAGDGSTLSLDFTAMSSLDSRFTFSRSSTATVINSSGLVQWANANIVRRSEDCTNWGGVQNITPTADAAIAPNGTQTADQLNLLSTSYKYQQTAANKVIGGQRYTGSIYVRAVSGTVQVNLRIANAADGNNGVAVTQTVGETWTRLQGSFTLASNGTLIDIGLDQRTGIPNAGPGVAANVYVWGLQLQPGGTAGEYLQTTTTENYNTPRFDYDPTTLAPRGLLIEGSATNLATYSADFSNVIWVVDNGSATNPSVSVVSQTAPDGGASVNRITFNKTGGTFSRIKQTLSGTATATYTFSVWLKANTASGGAATQNVGLRIGADAAGFNCVVTTTWKRFSYSYALSGTDATAQIMLWDNIIGNDETADVLVWGAQLEAGSGASSYIPTGSSTVQRAAESCSIAASSSWLNTASGTFVANWHRGDRGGTERSVLSSDYIAGRLLQLNNTDIATSVSLLWWSGNIFRTTGAAINKAAYTYGQTTGSGATLQLPVRLCVNNSAVATGTFGNGTTNGADVPNPVNWTNFVIGAASASAPYTTASRDWLNNCVRSIKYWPTVLPDATLQSLTQ